MIKILIFRVLYIIYLLMIIYYTDLTDIQSQYEFWRSQDFIRNQFSKIKCSHFWQLKTFPSVMHCFSYRKSQINIFIVSSHFENETPHFISLSSYILVMPLSILQAIVCSYLLFYSVNTVCLKNTSYYSIKPVGSQISVWQWCSLLSQPLTQGSSFQIYERKHFFL